MTQSDDETSRIAAQVLGKTADGQKAGHYQTPDNIDASLLVGIPRHLNRLQYDIDAASLPFVGCDTWNAYEFSCLLDNGYPVTGWVRWSYSAASDNIVESKSAKLYLNSFNMAKLGKTVDSAVLSATQQIQKDLGQAIGSAVDVHFIDLHKTTNAETPFNGQWLSLESLVDISSLSFEHAQENPELLIPIASDGKIQRYTTPALRSNCRVTNQPDWGDVFIHIKGDKTLSPASLLQYIVSMRQENHFHEEICECIYQRLHQLLQPEELLVACLYTRRGGIDINPVRASHPALMTAHSICYADRPTAKTLRQ